MSTHPMTPQEIAMQAVFEVYPGLQTGLSEDTAEAYRLRDCILTAAAKMVRQTGVEKALSSMAGNCTRYLEERPVPMSEMYQDNPPPTILEEANASLTALRALTEHSGKPNSPPSPYREP